jgi:hypothetical protein
MPHTYLEAGDVAPQRSSASLDGMIPQGIVRLLPPAAFHSLAFQAEEDAAIWTRSWVCAGFAQDIPGVGDVLPFTAGNHGIHIERLADGSFAGRFNKAQHGGCRSVPVQCQTGAKTKCSFTACGYSRDRRPIAARDSNRAASLDQYFGLRPERLFPVAIKAWGPLLLAQLDPDARSAFVWPDPVAIIGDAVVHEAGGAMATHWIEYDANWKRLAVSFAEGAINASGVAHAVVSGQTKIEAAILFPNVVILIDPVVTAIVVLQPTALGRTLCRIRFFGRDLSAPLDEAARERLVATIAVRAAMAEALQRDDAGKIPAEPSGDVRRWFDGGVLTATEAWRDEQEGEW